jgi:ABC-type antimicrobial peptide transport system permease subunit
MQNSLKSTYRNFVRKPATNLINLLGLSVSLALVIILSVYCYSELTTDSLHKNGDSIFLYGDFKEAVLFPALLKDQIDSNVPGVESTVRISGTWNVPVFQVENREPITSDLIFADDDFFKLFTYKSVEGDLLSALKAPMSVVITKSLAGKLFGRDTAVGKTMKLNNSYDLTVAAVIDKPDGNTCLSFNAVTSNTTKKIVQPNGNEFTSWNMGGFMTFVLLKKGVNPGLIAKSIYSLMPEGFHKKGTDFMLNSFNKIYFSKAYFSKFSLVGNYIRFGDKSKVLILLMVAAMVLMIALVNFVNISSSQWWEKIKQTGVMKILGAKRSAIFVTLQFIVAIVLIAFTVLVQKQVRFGNNLGFNHENIIGIKLNQELSQKKDVLKQMLLEKFPVKKVSYSMYYPGEATMNWGTKLNLNGVEKDVTIDMFNADASVFEMMELKLMMGRFYSDNLSSDHQKILVNETFLRNYGITNPIGGKMIVTMDNKNAEIIGVVKDFHFKSVAQPITPLVITNGLYTTYCLVKLRTSGFKEFHSAIQDIKSEASKLSPSFPVEISFFDQAVEQMYQSELLFRRTFTLFAGSAIVICCMGILAMSLFACQRRTKEIGIRKVNGARVAEVLAMLNRDFMKWVAIAFVIATPIAYYAMNKWLESFAYKTELSWWVFVLAGLLALGIALLTVSWQSWRAATSNPVEALRYE